MQLQVFSTPELTGQAAATLFAAQLIHKPDSVLGLATGATPLPIYQQLISLYKQGLLDFSRASSFNLDEYCGISPQHEQSYAAFMQDNLFYGINLPAENRHIPRGDLPKEDLEAWRAECRRYDQRVAEAGGIDMQLLGIGGNGHIGFNEPAEEFTGDTHIVQLTPATIADNSRFFDSPDQVPTQAVTMGIRGILAARHIVLVATGEKKAGIVKALMQSEITPKLPASILHTHPRATFLVDQAAARYL